MLDRRVLAPSLVALGLVAIALAETSAARPPRKTAPTLPPLNQKVVAFARERLGKQVGDGECTSLAAEALEYAGARRFPYRRDGDYAWGDAIASFDQALPGDILQFRNAVFQGRRLAPGPRVESWRQEYPHHTAIVASARDEGREIVILHQNVGRSGSDEATERRVKQDTIRPESLLEGGVVRIYRPIALQAESASEAKRAGGRTVVSIEGDAFHVNGQPTYRGRSWRGKSVEGLLLNARVVQGLFDDRNPETRARWAYPDTGRWDPERNIREFLQAMPTWRAHGLLGITLNLQGGSPQGYSRGRQPWHNSAFEEDGSLRPDYLARLARVLDRADELGMVVILGLFYFGQDERLRDEAAVVRAVDGAVDWLLERGDRNVLVEVNNECDVRHDHPILQPRRVHELISRVASRSRSGRSLLVGTSYGGGKVPGENVVRASDFLLMHGNGVSDPDRIAEMVRQARAVPGYRPMPILFNEDDHFEFDQPRNNFAAALSERASWGYFDPGQSNYRDGYQSPPVDWGIGTDRKKAFFARVREISGVGAP